MLYSFCLSKAKGKDCWSRGIDGKERFKIIGRTLGRMHRLSMLYNCCDAAKKAVGRNPHLVKARCILRNYNADLSNKFDSYMSLCAGSLRMKAVLRLVHGDFLFSNYYFDDDNNIFIFDFDECSTHGSFMT